jgi:hypothetical protein
MGKKFATLGKTYKGEERLVVRGKSYDKLSSKPKVFLQKGQYNF